MKVKLDSILGKLRELDDAGEKGDPGVGITLIEDNGDGTLTLTYGSGSATVITSDLSGNDGREVELQKGTTHIQRRYVGDATWTDLIAISELQGDPGTPGDDGNGISGIELISTVGKVKTYRITFTDTTTFDYTVTDGTDGTGSGDISGSGTANEIAYFTAEKVIDNLPVATYPNLTELSYVKGVTSSIQTQLNGKQASGSYEVTTNKENTTIDTSTTKYPTVNLLKTGLDTKQNTMTKATGAEVDTGTDDAKFVTAKAVADSKVSYIDGTETLTNKWIQKRCVTTTQSATPTINTNNGDIFQITGLTQAITSFTTNLTGTAVNGQMMMIEITDNGTARAITWGASFEASTVALPTTTVISTLLKVLFQWNVATSKWRCIAVA